jgi:hypothetical protein
MELAYIFLEFEVENLGDLAARILPICVTSRAFD